MSHVFISYSRKDKKVVGQYVESLRKQDFIVWQDVSDISAGEKWHQALLDAIEQASAIVVFWSHSALHSPYVKEEIDHALKHNKHIIPVWLDSSAPLRDDLKEMNAVITGGYSSGAVQKLSRALLERVPRIQRQVLDFNTSIPMREQTIEGTSREVIGNREYLIVPLVQSVYSSACVIAEAATIVRQAARIQLIVQNTGPVDYATVRDAFKAILAVDAASPEEAEPIVGLHITGSRNPLDNAQYWIDNTNVAHYSDMIDTTRKSITALTRNAADTQMIQMFQKTLVDIAFLLGVSLDRWIPLQLYKWDGEQYVPIINVPPRSPN